MTEQGMGARRPSSQAADIFNRLLTAVRSVWVYSLSGVIIGGLFVYGAAMFDGGHGPLAKFLEHLGMGFIVAAIAVLFYEWGAHIKDSIKLSEDLTAIKSAVGENALEGALRVLIRGEHSEYDDEMVRRVITLVDHVRGLQLDGDWAREGYVRFLYRLLKDVTDNAESLRKISAELRRNPAATVEYHVVVQSPAALTDIMLAEQMNRLQRGGRYSVASNPRAWQSNQLNELHEETKNAAQRGVVIRRIFVLTRRGGPHSHNVDVVEARNMIRDHFEQSKKWPTAKGGRYEIKLLDDITRDRLASQAAAFMYDNHFGVFQASDEDHGVLVQVTAPDLSDLRIRGVSSMSPYRRHWETVWKQLAPATSELIDQMLESWEESDKR